MDKQSNGINTLSKLTLSLGLVMALSACGGGGGGGAVSAENGESGGEAETVVESVFSSVFGVQRSQVASTGHDYIVEASGVGLAGASSVTVNGESAAIVNQSDSHIRFIAPGIVVAGDYPVDITVNGTVLSRNLSYRSPISNISSIAVDDADTYLVIDTGELQQLSNAGVPATLFGMDGSTDAKSVIDAASGSRHRCIVLADGAAQCWGANNDGQIGIAAGGSSSIAGVTGIDGVAESATAVATGYSHSCALLDDASVKCWGRNFNGELGNNTEISTLDGVPVPVSGIDGIASSAIAIAAGLDHSCALLDSGAVQCWGNASGGHLGNGETTGKYLTPVPVTGLSVNVIAIASGSHHSCAVMNTGAVKCWGLNTDGQLGQVSYTDTASSTPIAVDGIDGVTGSAVDISVSNYSSCATLISGAVQCWGGNSNGQLGSGDLLALDTPATVKGLDGSSRKALKVTGSYDHTCVLMDDGTAQCWGGSHSGVLGEAMRAEANSPLVVSAIDGTNSKAYTVSAGESASCAIVESGAVKCWGLNNNGQLGNATYTSEGSDFSHTLLGVDGIDGSSDAKRALDIAVGTYYACAVLKTGAVQCWGYNDEGELGSDSAVGQHNSPVTVHGIDGVNNKATQVAVHKYHSCAILESGALQCWGSGSDGQLGDGNDTESWQPVDVSGIDGVAAKAVSISLGEYSSCAALATGEVRCWGVDDFGLSALVPQMVAGLDGIANKVVSISRSTYDVCVVLETGAVKCWGDYTGSNTPVDFASIDGVSNKAVRVSVGNSYHCAELATGAIQCWGNNSSGVLGDGSFDSSSTPVDVIGFDGSNAQLLSWSTGSSHVCAVVQTGVVMCWGDNTAGELGNDIMSRLAPAIELLEAPVI